MQTVVEACHAGVDSCQQSGVQLLTCIRDRLAMYGNYVDEWDALGYAVFYSVLIRFASRCYGAPALPRSVVHWPSYIHAA